MVGCGWARKNVTWSASPRWSKACLIWGWNTKKHIAAVQSYSLCFTMFTRQKQRILQQPSERSMRSATCSAAASSNSHFSIDDSGGAAWSAPDMQSKDDSKGLPPTSTAGLTSSGGGGGDGELVFMKPSSSLEMLSMLEAYEEDGQSAKGERLAMAAIWVTSELLLTVWLPPAAEGKVASAKMGWRLEDEVELAAAASFFLRWVFQ
uniref:Uncharacterized protein n=2 Tax=Oryza rufipogon TaxID=4529 RepID=A0A0E0RD54_ORYRU